MKNKRLEKIRNRIKYKRIVKIAENCEYDKFHKRHIVDLKQGYLFYFPESGKILTTRKGVVYRSKNELWYTKKELKELLKEIETLN